MKLNPYLTLNRKINSNGLKTKCETRNCKTIRKKYREKSSMNTQEPRLILEQRKGRRVTVELKPLQLCCKLWEIKCRNGDVNMDLMWWPKDRCDE